MTVAELLLTGTPAILVPLPGAPRDHQTKNAQALVAMGAAELLTDAACDGDRLGHAVQALLDDPARLDRMRASARGHGQPDAARQVAALVDVHAR